MFGLGVDGIKLMVSSVLSGAPKRPRQRQRDLFSLLDSFSLSCSAVRTISGSYDLMSASISGAAISFSAIGSNDS